MQVVVVEPVMLIALLQHHKVLSVEQVVVDRVPDSVTHLLTQILTELPTVVVVVVELVEVLEQARVVLVVLES
jgi:hypothetical protein